MDNYDKLSLCELDRERNASDIDDIDYELEDTIADAMYDSKFSNEPIQ